jgi:hypothetical protein
MATGNHVVFQPGTVVATPGALDALNRTGRNALDYVARHVSGDWGIVDEADRQANDQALQSGARLMSAYFLPDETQLWIITEAKDEQGQRQGTTLLLPEEY